MTVFLYIHISKLAELFVDTFLLTCFISPALFLFLYRPIVRMNNLLEKQSQNLSNQNKFLKEAIDALPESFYVINAKNYKVELSNAVAKARGVTPGVLCYAATHDRNAPCEGKTVACPLAGVKISKKPVVEEHSHYDSKGNSRFFEVHGAPILNADGDVVSMIEYSMDITERKKLEKMVILSEKMSAIGQLSAGLVHEINNPLATILGFSQSAVKHLEANDPLEIVLKSIEREAARCIALVRNLLMFSRTGKTEKDEIDLNETIESSLSLVLAQAKVKNVELVKEFTEIPKIYANKNQIQEVIINLCGNAMDAMPRAGVITIRTKLSRLGEKEAIEIQVEDTGQGIPREIQAKIFEPFFTTKEPGKGTGLGLSLVYEIIQKHQGSIKVESEMGKGSTFYIYFPLAGSR